MAQASVQEPREFTPSSPPAAAGDKSAVPETLRLFAEGFFEGAGPVLSTMLNRPVRVGVVAVEEATHGDLPNRVSPPWVVVETHYTRGLTGAHWLVLPKPSAVALGHALVGEEAGEAVEFVPAHEEAIRETANQILATASSALMPLVGRSLAFAPSNLRIVEAGGPLAAELGPPAARLWLIRAEAKAPESFRIELVLTIGSGLAEEIVAMGAEINPVAPAGEPTKPDAGPSTLDLILDVTLPVTVELGRARMQIQDILKLAPGSVIELEKSAGDPVELFINDRPIAKGEVVVIDENFGVRLTSIVTAAERIRTLR